MFHTFDTEVAELFHDTNIATLFQNLCYWIIHNKTNEKNRKEIEINGKVVERYFTFNSTTAFTKQFSYFTKKQIENYLAKLKEKGLIAKATFNEKGFDRTSWFCLVDEEYWMKKYLGSEIRKDSKPAYTPDDEAEPEETGSSEEYPEYEEKETKSTSKQVDSHVDTTPIPVPDTEKDEIKITMPLYNGADAKQTTTENPSQESVNLQFFHFPKTGNAFPQNGKCISSKGEMHFLKRGNAFPQNGRPIPDINSYSKPNYKQNTASAVRTTLHEIDPTLILDSDFYPAAAAFLNRFDLGEEYLRWFYTRIKESKNINNVHGYFFMTFFKKVYVERYKALRTEQESSLKNSQGQPVWYVCPVCGQTQRVSSGTHCCECCNAPINPSPDEIGRFTKLFEMDEATKEAYIFARSKVLCSGGTVSENLKELDKQFGIVS
jgi:hypothetical protein